MNKVDEYRQILRSIEDWDAYLLKESNLPGRRANIELARAVADEGDEKRFERYLSFDAEKAPANTPGEFLAFCGVLGMGRLLAEGQIGRINTLRICASDPRWRVREAVAMALQRWGGQDMEALIAEMSTWAYGGCLEQRAAAAGLCEPSLLSEKKQVEEVLGILDAIMSSILGRDDCRTDDFKTLRKGLGYCWSVAVVAYPERGKGYMEKWAESEDKDIRWIVRENLKKKRLNNMDASWVNTLRSRLE